MLKPTQLKPFNKNKQATRESCVNQANGVMI